MTTWRSRLPEGLLITAMVGISLLTYSSVLGQSFAGTDTFPLIETGSVDSPTAVLRLLSNPMMAGTGFTSIARYYRPVSSLSFGVDHSLWGLNPAGYHWTTLAAHTLNSVLLFLLLRSQGKTGWMAAGLGAALFLLHPAMRDVIPVTSRRQDVLALLFGLLALMAHRRAVTATGGSRVFWLAAIGLLGLAILAKELAVIFVALIPADRLLMRYQPRQSLWRNVGQAAREAVPYLLLFGGLLLLRWIALGGLGGEGGRGEFTGSDRVRRLAAVASGYARELMDPEERLGMERGSAGAWVMLALAVLAGAGAGWLQSRPTSAVRSGTEAGTRSEAGPARCRRDVVGLWILAVLLTASAVWLAAGLRLGWPIGSNIGLQASAARGGWMVLVIGLLAVAACTRLRRKDARLSSEDSLRRLAYYSLWILLPLAIYLVTLTFSARLVYLPAAGLGAVIALAADEIGRALTASSAPSGLRVLLAGGLAPLLLFAVGLLLTSSPLASGLGEWPVKARLNLSLLNGLGSELDAAGSCPTIIVRGLPDRGALGLEEYSLQSWLRLRFPETSSTLRLADRVRLDYIPETILLTSTGCQGGMIEILATPQ